jgi:hypothetical protein
MQGSNFMMEQDLEEQSVPSVKSQPVYARLTADPLARQHVLVAESAGLEAVLRVTETLRGSGAPVEIYWLGKEPTEFEGRGTVCVFKNIAALGEVLAHRLRAAEMGLRLYLAGREAFLWQVNLTAREAGLREDEIQRQACGSRARRVFCVHCRHMVDEVTSNPVPCPSCGVLLEVRDHFSRALAAYIGVVVNAEDPMDAPEPEEQFL